MAFHQKGLRWWRRWGRPGLEAAGLCFVLWVSGQAVFKDGAWGPVGGLPFWALGPLWAGVYGLRGGVVGAGAVVVTLGTRVLSWEGLVAALVTLGAILGRRLYDGQVRAQRERLREVVSRNHRLRRENRALTETSRVLEERLSRQRRFLTFLLKRVHALEAADLQGALDGILGLVRTFAGAEQASLWRHEPAARRLAAVATLGWPEAEVRALVPLADEGTIPGWVARNASPFSLRMTLDQDHFRRMAPGRHLMTYPLRVGDRVWGVLNIEALPFVQYSRYTETVVEIILALGGRVLGPLLEREALFARQEVHETTGLPLASLLFKVLGEDLARGTRVAVGLLEVEGSAALDDDLGRLAGLVKAQGAGTEVFHYKQDNQLAFLVRGKDADGMALFCLDLLGALHDPARFPGGRPPEVLLGYDTPRGEGAEAVDLLDHAERLVRMQRP